jgi:hypothetical protein
MRATYRTFFFYAIFLGICALAHAAPTCISNVSQIQPALTAAQSNGVDDVIYLEVGTYNLTTELHYTAAAGEDHILTLIGGLAPGCQSGYASSGATVLDGQNMTRILTIDAQGAVNIGRISFVNASATQYFGGAVNLTNESAQDTYIFANVFLANKTASGLAAGALYVESSTLGDIYVWSNLFLANTGSGGAGAIYANAKHDAYFTGNTIVGNQISGATGLGALDLAGTGNYWISNNILWNNAVADLYDQVGHARFASNDIGVKAGFPPISEAGDLNVDPQFAGFFGNALSPSSPLVNAGKDNPPGGVGGCCDPVGQPRVQGAHVDIGAYETDVLFRNGFNL